MELVGAFEHAEDAGGRREGGNALVDDHFRDVRGGHGRGQAGGHLLEASGVAGGDVCLAARELDTLGQDALALLAGLALRDVARQPDDAHRLALRPADDAGVGPDPALLSTFGVGAHLDLVVLALAQSRLHGRGDALAVVGVDQLQVLLVVARLRAPLEPVDRPEVLGPADHVGRDVPLPAPGFRPLEDLLQQRLAGDESFAQLLVASQSVSSPLRSVLAAGAEDYSCVFAFSPPRPDSRPAAPQASWPAW